MNANVAEAKKIVARLAEADRRTEADRWRLAELTYNAVKGGMPASRWAREVGVSEPTARRYFNVHERFVIQRTDSSPETTFTEAFNLVQGRPADRARGEEAFNALSEDRQAAVIQKAMTKPEVAKKVVADRPTVQAIDTARTEVARERLAPHMRPVNPVEAQAEADDAALIEVRSALMQIGRLYRRLLQVAPNLADADRGVCARELAGVTRWHDGLRDLLSGHDLDDELAELLREGA